MVKVVDHVVRESTAWRWWKLSLLKEAAVFSSTDSSYYGSASELSFLGVTWAIYFQHGQDLEFSIGDFGA